MFSAKDHSFVICAYKENPHLEETIISLKNQTVKSKIYLTTSTPNSHILNLCKKYEIEYFINEYPKNAGADWNYGYDNVPSQLVTLAHQDDIYNNNFLEETLKAINDKCDFIIAFTDYYEIRNDGNVYDNKLLKIKRLMNAPFKNNKLQKSRFIKRRNLSIGCSICCPAVTYNKELAGSSVFDTTYINSCDYKTWCDLAEKTGRFVYINKQLLGHRIYAESATSKNLGENIRKREDLEILSMYWPRFIAKVINHMYAKSEKSNEL